MAARVQRFPFEVSAAQRTSGFLASDTGSASLTRNALNAGGLLCNAPRCSGNQP